MASVLFRTHDWIAHRVRWVQYPRIVPRTANARLSFFKTQMPWPLRVLLVVIGVVVLIGCAIALFFLGVLFWAVITA